MKLIQKLNNPKYYNFRLFVENIFNHVFGYFLFQYRRKDNLFSWYYDCLVYQYITCKNFAPKYNFYEFGVAGGGSMEIYILALKKFCKDYRIDIKKFHIFAFDSFEGLPEKVDGDNHPTLKKGEMRHSEKEVLNVVKRTKFPKENFHIIKGFYDQSLTEKLKDRLLKYKPAIINIDCDYYSSTITLMRWILPLLNSGCFFRFDDIWAFHGNPNYGELKAIDEFNSWNYGYLVPFPLFGLYSYTYIFSKKEFEYSKNY